tara:strand:- start:65 stop:385 length:321 start_codon:yes stop_codon:yes gene_type:complete
MKIKLNTIIILTSFFFVLSCSGAKDAIQGSNRSDKSDEFLVEKKKPLSMPPDFNELPEPSNNEIDELNSSEELKNKLKISSGKKKDIKKKGTNNSLENKILEQIKE